MNPLYFSPQSLFVKPHWSNGKAVDEFYGPLFTLKYRVIEKMDGIWNRYNLKSTGRIYTFGILKCSEKFKVLDLP